MIDTLQAYCTSKGNIDTIVNLLKSHGYYLHHTAMAKGYISRTISAHAENYTGRYGNGIALHIPSNKGTQYHYLQYWIKKEN